MNLASLLDLTAKARPDHPAVETADERLTHAETAARVRRLAGALARAGVGRADPVGLCLGDHALHLLLHFAVARLGACIVPLDHRWAAPEKARVAAAFRCRLVVHEEGDGAFASLPCLPAPALAAEEADAPAEAQAEDLPVVLSLSSGTTGTPRGALVTHRQLYERFVSQWATMSFHGGDRFLLATPLYFGGGRSFAMSFLVAGGTTILRPPPHAPLALVRAAAETRASVVFLVPTQLRRLLDDWQGDGPAFPGLRLLVSSGSALHADEKARVLDRLTPNLMDYYASSEGGGIAVLPPWEQRAFPGSVGRPTFRVEVEVTDAEGRPLPTGETGLLRYRGPGVSSHLVEADGSLSEAPPGGWFAPGDLAQILPGGHLVLRGRGKDMIIRGGVNIYPAEVEAALLALPEVADCGVVGLPHAALGQIVAAGVVLRRGAAATPESLSAALAGSLAPYRRPAVTAILPELPKNSSGKTDKARLAALLQAGS